MKLHFLGGADEIGASCTFIEIEGRRILVDAGIRPGAAQGARLPNFSVLDDVGMPDAVLVTHAHTDHTGALPVLASSLPPGVKVYATPATKAITQVLLMDAANLMAPGGIQDAELPLYPPEAIDAALGLVEGVPWLTTVPICDGALTATWIPAGHILGAASIYIEGKRESILMTGDISVANQLTIPGLIIPQCRPNVMVLESTYGNRQHADREQQETALALRVAEVIKMGGKVLIPAFAVGRSQEVILILARAMRRNQIPEFPIYVDGMVRSVNAIYSAFGDDLASPVRRRINRGERVFYSNTVQEVAGRSERRKALSGPPCCIVASSGMLNGGASTYYAQTLVGKGTNLIALTGYQDEESPGRALLDLIRAKEQDERVLTLNGKRVPVKCSVEPYSLSAHADKDELTGLVQTLKPHTCFLVHGDAEARRALSQSVDVHVQGGVQLPENGGVYTVEPPQTLRRGYGRRVSRAGIANDKSLSEETLADVHAYCIETGAKGPFRTQELTEMWFGTEMTTPAEVEVFRLLLSYSKKFFTPDEQRPYLFHLNETPQDDDGPMEMNEARARVMAAFPPEAGLFKCGVHMALGTFELAFHFPAVAQQQYADLFSKLEREIGWTIRLRETPHQERVFEEAHAAVPNGAKVTKTPALRMDQAAVILTVAVGKRIAGHWDEVSRDATAKFKAKTGIDLIWNRLGDEQREDRPPRRDGAWEINKAFTEIRKAFWNQPHTPIKMGLRGNGYIEAAFISPEVGNRYRALLDKVSDKIGWKIEVRPAANQALIAREARAITPQQCVIRGGPKFYIPENRLVVPVLTIPEDADTRAAAFEANTGFAISWEEKK